MSDAAPWFYSIFVGETREECEEVLGPGAFDIAAPSMVERLLAANYRPDVLDPSHEPLMTSGVTTSVRMRGRTFIVSIDERLGLISVQERTDEPYSDE